MKRSSIAVAILFSLTSAMTAAAQAGKPRYSDPEVLEMTKPVLADFERGLRTEVRLRTEFLAFLSKLKTPQQYQACQGEVLATPEAQAIARRMADLPETTPAEQVQKVMTKMSEDLAALLKKKCGIDATMEWPESKRAAKRLEFEHLGALDAGPDTRPVVKPELEDGDNAALGVVDIAAFPYEGITDRAYAILKERTIALCNALAAGIIKVGNDGVSIPGTKGRVFFVWGADEVKAVAAKCKDLMPLINQTT